jgi:hypothetical protein
MHKTEIAPGIVIYKEVMANPKDLIDQIESSVSFNAISWGTASVKSGDYDGVDKTKRDTLSIGIPYSKNPEENFSSPSTAATSLLSKIFLEAFEPIERNYANSYGITIPVHDSYSILKYTIGQKFVNHIDDHVDFHRRVSAIYYMNDDYEGGEINFPRFGISYKPMANEMLLFPSTYVYNHSVNEVTQGTRYAVVSWMR